MAVFGGELIEVLEPLVFGNEWGDLNAEALEEHERLNDIGDGVVHRCYAQPALGARVDEDVGEHGLARAHNAHHVDRPLYGDTFGGRSRVALEALEQAALEGGLEHTGEVRLPCDLAHLARGGNELVERERYGGPDALVWDVADRAGSRRRSRLNHGWGNGDRAQTSGRGVAHAPGLIVLFTLGFGPVGVAHVRLGLGAAGLAGRGLKHACHV